MKASKLLASFLALAGLSTIANAANILVTTTAGSGPGSFSAALTSVQAGDTIGFNIPGAGPHYIATPAGGFPLLIQDNVTIDGYSQPGAVANTNPNTASNNAQIKIVLDSRNGNYRAMEYTAFTPANSSPPIDNSAMSGERGGYGDTEVAILGIYRATNVNVRGLAFLSDTYTGDISTYCVAVGHDYGLNTNVLDRLAYDAGSSRDCHINGCWFGVDPANPTVAGVTRAAAAIAFFRHRDVNGGPRPELPNESLLVGVKPGSANARAEFNVFAYQSLTLAGEAIRTHFSGNFLGVMPDGITPSGIPDIFGGGIEIGRYDDTQPIVLGTDGDGVNDADEGNLFGPLQDGGVVLALYSTGNKPYVVSGNRFGIGVNGARWDNSQLIWDSIANNTQVQFGTDFDGVSDALEANVIYNNYPPATVSPATYPPMFVVSAGSVLSLRGNTLVNNYTPPVDPLASSGDLITNYYARILADTNSSFVPVLSTNSTVSRLIGTVPLPGTNYPVVLVDVYVPDPEGITNGIAAGIPELPDGYIQGRTYLGTFVADGAGDLDPAAGAFEFDISSLGVPLNTPLTIAATYSSSPAGTDGAAGITTLFAVPVAVKAGSTAPAITSVSVNGANLIINWAGGTPPYQLQKRANFNTGTPWVNEGAASAATTATIPISGSQDYFRVQGQ